MKKWKVIHLNSISQKVLFQMLETVWQGLIHDSNYDPDFYNRSSKSTSTNEVVNVDLKIGVSFYRFKPLK